MKRLLYHLTIFLTFAAVLSACEKETPDTTYTFRDNYGMYDQAKKKIDEAGATGTVVCDVTFVFFEYNADKMCVAQRSVMNVSKGSPKKFTANKDAVYITVGYKYNIQNKNTGKTASESLYMANVFTLKAGDNIDISVYDNTIFRAIEPIR